MLDTSLQKSITSTVEGRTCFLDFWIHFATEPQDESRKGGIFYKDLQIIAGLSPALITGSPTNKLESDLELMSALKTDFSESVIGALFLLSYYSSMT